MNRRLWFLIVFAGGSLFLVNWLNESDQQPNTEMEEFFRDTSVNQQNSDDGFIDRTSSGGSRLETQDSNIDVITHTITAQANGLTPAEIEIPKGQRVALIFRSEVDNQTLSIPDYGIIFPVLQAGQSISILFYADQAGTFQYYNQDKTWSGRMIIQ